MEKIYKPCKINKSNICTCSFVVELKGNKTKIAGQEKQNNMRHFTFPLACTFSYARSVKNPLREAMPG
jgi:hypothetical protein